MRLHTLVLGLSLILSACGGGGSSGDSPLPTGTTVTLTPAEASTLPGQTIQLAVSGGKGPYRLTTSDPSVLPLSASLLTNLYSATFRVTAQDVPETRTVTISVVDSLGGVAKSEVEVRYPPLSLSPGNLTLGSGIVQTYHIYGGMRPYNVSVTRPDLFYVSTVAADRTFTVTPKPVAAEVGSLAVSVTDGGGATVSGDLTIFPATVFSSVVVDPIAPATGTVSGLAENAVRSGLQGIATAQLADGYANARALRYRWLQGPFVFDGADTQGVLQISSDETGRAIAPFTTNTGASTQYGKFRVEDIASGAGQDVVFVVAGLQLAALPAEITTVCGGVSMFRVFGGKAPYQVLSSNPSVAAANPATLTADGGAVTLAHGAACAGGTTSIVIRDAAGDSVTVSFRGSL